MQDTTEKTTLVSLFHTQEQAEKAMQDLKSAGLPAQSIETLGGASSRSAAPEATLASLKALSLPPRDLQMLSDGLKGGGTLIIVRAEQALSEKAEDIFESHYAQKIDERAVSTGTKPVAAATAAAAKTASDTVIPIVEEELSVGKRQVQRGGVRVYSRMVETPVEETVTLRQEHASVERHAVNRPISEAELDRLQDQSIEVREMDEEAVVAKTARVVEEVHVDKETSQRTQQISDTVRKTQVEVEELVTDTETAASTNKAAQIKR